MDRPRPVGTSIRQLTQVHFSLVGCVPHKLAFDSLDLTGESLMTPRQTKLLWAFGLALLLGLSLSHVLTTPNRVSAWADGPPASHTGAPSERTCQRCHSTYPLDDPSGSVVIGGLPASYTPGQPIDFTVTVSQDGTDGARIDWGFQLTVLDANNLFVGTLVASDAVNTLIVRGDVDGSERAYVEQTQAGTFFNPDGAASATWTVTWVPPDTDAGPVTFYVVGNAGNGDRRPTGDYIFTGSQALPGPGGGAVAGASPRVQGQAGWQRYPYFRLAHVGQARVPARFSARKSG